MIQTIKKKGANKKNEYERAIKKEKWGGEEMTVPKTYSRTSL
jgi:hypothetical protein